MKTNSLLLLVAVLCGSMAYAKEPLVTATGKVFHIYSVTAGKKGDRTCRNYYGDCLVFSSDKPVMSIAGVTFEKLSGQDKPGIIINLNAKERASLKEVSKSHLGQQIAIVYKDVIIHSPKIKTIIDSDQLQMTFCNKRNYEVVIKSLEGDIDGNDAVFKKEYDCDCTER